MPRVKNLSGIGLKTKIRVLGERVAHECAWFGLGLKFMLIIRSS